MKKIFILSIKYFLLFAATSRLQAQNSIFLNEGKVEFERKVNLYSQLDDDDAWSELEKKTMPKFKVTYFDLAFSKNKTWYQPGRDNPDNNKLWSQPAEENIIISDFETDKCISQKKVFGETFLVQDSIRNIQWKITDETRTIAGFQCRRANAVMMDSIYVVAFYTDEIIVAGGPESFSGLPGMILGIALPHEHITWFATKVSAVASLPPDSKIPTKGKKVDNKMLKETMQESLKDWGKHAQRFIKAAMM